MRSAHASHETGQLLSLADIARHFDLPESTARYYCKRFAEFIPVVGEGRRRRYRQESLAVLAAVMEHMHVARTAAGVEEVLGRQFPRVTETLVPVRESGAVSAKTAYGPAMHEALPAMAMQLLEKQTMAMEGVATALNILARRQDELQRLTETAQSAAEENAFLRREIADMRVMLHSAEKIHQSDLEQLRVWLGRALRSRADQAASQHRTSSS